MTNLQAVQVLRKNSKEFQKKGGIVIVFVLLFDGAVNTVGIQLESNWIFAVSHVFLWCFSFFCQIFLDTIFSIVTHSIEKTP